IDFEDRRRPDLLLQAARPVGGRCGQHDCQRVLQAGVFESADGVCGGGAEAARREFGGECGLIRGSISIEQLPRPRLKPMPPNENCPSCGANVPDWHREWHTPEDQNRIFHGNAGMECPLCGGVVIHARWLTPLTAPPHGSHVEKVKRDVTRAAYWATVNAGKRLEEYLKTTEGKPHARFWSSAEVQEADRYVANNPLQPP